jgi:hypothetical protein
MFLIDIIWFAVLLTAAGAVFYSTPEWIRKQYVRSAKNRKTTPLKREDWQAKEQFLGKAFIAAGIVVLILRLVSSGIVIDAAASVIFFAMIVWRTFSFLGS